MTTTEKLEQLLQQLELKQTVNIKLINNIKKLVSEINSKPLSK